MSEEYLKKTKSEFNISTFKKNTKVEVLTKSDNNPLGWYTATIVSVSNQQVYVKYPNSYGLETNIKKSSVRKAQSVYNFDEKNLKFQIKIDLKFPAYLTKYVKSTAFQEIILEFVANKKMLCFSVLESGVIHMYSDFSHIDSVYKILNEILQKESNGIIYNLIQHIDYLVKRLDRFRNVFYKNNGYDLDFYTYLDNIPELKDWLTKVELNTKDVLNFKEQYLMRVLMHDSNTVLTLGEENFSFPYCLQSILSENTTLLTTSYKNDIYLRSYYKDSFDYYTTEIKARGGICLHEVDCCKLENTEGIDSESVDYLIFNFPLPHKDERIDEFDYRSEHVKTFLGNFFKSANKVLSDRGVVFMSLPVKDYKLFDVNKIAENNGFGKLINFDFNEEVLKFIYKDYKPFIPSAYEHNGQFQVISRAYLYMRQGDLQSDWVYGTFNNLYRFYSEIFYKYESAEYEKGEFINKYYKSISFEKLLLDFDIFKKIANYLETKDCLVTRVLSKNISETCYKYLVSYYNTYTNDSAELNVKTVSMVFSDPFFIKKFVLLHKLHSVNYFLSPDHVRDIYSISLNYLTNVKQYNVQYVVKNSRAEFIKNMKNQTYLRSVEGRIIKDAKNVYETILKLEKDKKYLVDNKRVDTMERVIYLYKLKHQYFAKHSITGNRSTIYLECNSKGQANGCQYYCKYDGPSTYKWQHSFCSKPLVNRVYVIDRYGYSIRKFDEYTEYTVEVSFILRNNSAQIKSTDGMQSVMYPIYKTVVYKKGNSQEFYYGCHIKGTKIELIELNQAIKNHDFVYDSIFDFVICE